MTGFLKNLGVFALFALIIYMFYKSIFAFVLLPPAMIFYIRYDRRNRKKKESFELQSEFKDALVAITAALRAGYSVENSIREALVSMKQLQGENSVICRELTIMTNELDLGVPAADVFDSLAKRCDVEDISTFASVFRIAKRSGGDMVEIIRKTSDDISAKVDSRNEIAVMVSEKKLEQNIMSVMPLAILVYIDFTSSDLLAPLYGNFTGVCIMTVCLAVYVFAYWLGRRILNIDF